MADVFISYKREERKRCEHIAEKLTALGLDVWFDARLEAGVSFDREIERALGKAKAVLVLWSSKSVDSQWVRNEAGVGKKSNKLVAASLEECQLPVALVDVHHESLHDPNFQDDDAAWLKIVERIASLTERPTIVSYSLALAKAAKPLEEWARQNPNDPLANKMREKANLLGGAPAAAGKPKPMTGALITVGVISLALGLAGGTFGLSRLLPGPQGAAAAAALAASVTPKSVAASLVGRWGEIDTVTGEPKCEPHLQEIWLGSDGVALLVSGRIAETSDPQSVVMGRQTVGELADGWLQTSGVMGAIGFQRAVNERSGVDQLKVMLLDSHSETPPLGACP